MRKYQRLGGGSDGTHNGFSINISNEYHYKLSDFGIVSVDIGSQDRHGESPAIP